MNNNDDITEDQLDKKTKISISEANQAIDTGNVWVTMKSGKLWQARRNGKTKTWKRSPDKFQIPIKFGFKLCGYFTNDSIQEIRKDGSVIL